ncbi:MAG: hypothetical protein ACFFCM_14185 [Promethearchaeota archaeon]
MPALKILTKELNNELLLKGKAQIKYSDFIENLITAIFEVLENCGTNVDFMETELTVIKAGVTAVNPLLKYIDKSEIKLLDYKEKSENEYLVKKPFHYEILKLVLEILESIAKNKANKSELKKFIFPDQYKYISKFHQLAHQARFFGEFILKKSEQEKLIEQETQPDIESELLPSNVLLLKPEFCTKCGNKLVLYKNLKYCHNCNVNIELGVIPKYPTEYNHKLNKGYNGETTRQKVFLGIGVLIIVILAIIIGNIALWARNKEIFYFFLWALLFMYLRSQI